MRTKPAIPEPQGSTPMERMDWAFRTVRKVPKEAAEGSGAGEASARSEGYWKAR
jgi:hypothetical protein